MTARNAGSAFVKIRPDAKDFVRDLKRDLAAVKADTIDIPVSADVAQARADIKRFQESQRHNGFRMPVDMALAQADADLKAFRARQHANGLTVKVDADTGKAEREVAALRRQISGVGDLGSALRISVGAAGIAGLPAAALGLAQVAQALQQLAQGGLALPGIFAGATASVGTLVVGLSGIADAYEAVSAASTSAARDGVQAQNRLRNAVVDEVQARKDQALAYRDARNALDDLNVQMRGGLLDESRALLEAQKAREDLARGNYTDVRDAQLRVLEMDQRVLEARTRNAEKAQQLADANAKGIANSDQVVAANERVVRSQQAVADAAGGVSAAQQKADDAMAKLSPKARELVNTLQGLTPVALDLRNTIADIGLDGLSTKLEDTVHTLMPTLKDGLGGIAKGWNENFQQLFTSIGSDQSKGLLDRILGNTAEAQSRLTAAIDPLVHGVEVLSAAGTDALPRIADVIGDVAKRFDSFISEADKDGRLQKWIDEGMTAFGHLGETVLNLGKTWTAITKASGGGALLSTIDNLTNRLQAFLNSTEGQDKLKRFFDEGRNMIDQWRPILEALPGLFEGVYAGAKTYIGGVLDVIGPLAELLGRHPDLVATAIAAYAGWKAIGPIIDGTKTVLGGLSTALVNVGTGFAPVRDKAKAAMGEVDDIFDKAGKKGSGMGKWAGALAGLSAVGGPLIALGGAIASVAIPALLDLDNQHDTSAEHAKHLIDVENSLKDAINEVSAAITAQGRLKIAANFQESTLTGGPLNKPELKNALDAATSLGINGTDLVSAAAGDKTKADKIRQQLVDKVKADPAVGVVAQAISAANDIPVDRAADLVARAEIGDQQAINELSNMKVSKGAEAKVDQGFLDTQQGQFGDPARKSALVGRALNDQVTGVGANQNSTTQRNKAAAGTPELSSHGHEVFDQYGPTVVTDGIHYQVILSKPLTPEDVAALSGNGNTVEQYPAPDNRWYVDLGAQNIASDVVKGYEQGGPTPSMFGPLAGGGYPAVVHPKEWMVNQRGRSVLGDDFLAAANAGQVDMSKLAHFDTGGLVDQDGNPVTAGVAPGPEGPVASPVAPNPTASGGLGGIFGKVMSGIQGPIGNAINFGTSVINTGKAVDAAGIDPGQALAGRASQVPGLIGLFGSMSINDPKASEAAVTKWGTQALTYTANWATDTLSKGAGILWDGGNGAGGVLGLVGLDNSILSGKNSWNRAGQQAASFALGSNGPISTLMGAGNSGAQSSGSITDPLALAGQYGVTIDPTTGQAITSSMASDATLSPQFLQHLTKPGAGAAVSGAAGMTPPSGSGAEAWRPLVRATLKQYGPRYGITNYQAWEDAIVRQIATESGGNPTAINNYDSNAQAGHPSQGLLQFIPSTFAANNITGGDFLDPAAQIAAVLPYVTSRYGMAADGSPNHIGRGVGYYSGGPTPSSYGPVDAKGGHLAVVHPNEFMISARGRSRVPDAFLHALNQGIVDPRDLPKYETGGAVTAYVPPNPNLPIPTPPTPPTAAQPKVIPPTTAQPKVITPAAPGGGAAPSAPRPSVPSAPRPAAPPVTTPAAPPPSPQAAQAPYMSPQITTPTNPGAAPSSINHNLPAVSKGISSAASAIGQAISTAIGAAAGAAAGAAGIPGIGAAGAAGPYAAGLVTEGGKVVDAAVNVISSALVGNVPGSMGDPNAPAWGSTLRPEQNRPATAAYQGSRGDTNNFYGYTAQDVLRQKDNQDALKRQAMLATVRG